MDQLILRNLQGDASALGLNRIAWLSSMRDGLLGEYVLTRNNASAKLNPASAFAPQLSVVGVPDYGASIFAGAGLSQNNWYDTNLRDTQELTLAVAFKAPAGQSVLIGNFRGDNIPTNTSLLLQAGGVSGLVPATDGAQSTDAVAVDASTAWTIAMLRATGSANFTIKVDLYRAGVRLGGLTKATGKTRLVDTTHSFAIGSARGTAGAGTYNGSARYLLASVYGRAASDAEALQLAREYSLFGRACGVEL